MHLFARSVQRAKNRIVGDPFDLTTEQGPQIDKVQLDKILNLIDVGVREGAALLTGGKKHGEQGYFVQPTVFAAVQDHHTIAREEVSQCSTSYVDTCCTIFVKSVISKA